MGQDVQQETTDEFLDRKRHLAAPSALAVGLVGEGDLVIFETDEQVNNRVDPAGYPTGPPTDPDVRISRIRLLVTRLRYATPTPWTIRGRGSG